MLLGFFGWSCSRLLWEEGVGLMLRRFLPLVVGMVGFGLWPGVAAALPEGRVYEMVSPLYKAGQGAVLEAVAPNGESVEFDSIGSFAGNLWPNEAGNHYLARRTTTGWSTAAVGAPPVSGTADYSSTLERVLGDESPESSKEGAPGRIGVFLLRRTDVADTPENWEVAGGVDLKIIGDESAELRQKGLGEGESADLCHIVIGSVEGVLLPEAEGTSDQLYDLAAAPAAGCPGSGSSPLRLVSVKNRFGVHGEPEVISKYCGVALGIKTYGSTTNNFNAISADGGEIFFTTGVNGVPGTACSYSGQYQLFVRLGGERTLEVSKPLSEAESCGGEVPCPGALSRASANFVGASEDGSRVFFTTTARLSAGDQDSGNDLYMARIGCPGGEGEGCALAEREVVSLVQVSHDSTVGQAAELQGVVGIAADGSRVYFVAQGVLSSDPNAEGQVAEDGAENLYVYDAQTEGVAFVADLCSGPELSGSVEDGLCPANLNSVIPGRNDMGRLGGDQAQSTPDGRFLVFSSYARLLRGDTDTAQDIYRYDAQSGALVRVSLGEAGYEANGNNSSFNATIQSAGGSRVFQEYELGTRAVSDDGSRIVFSSAGPLSPGVVNGQVNVYEWREEVGQVEGGVVSLVSSGSSLSSDVDATISPSGRDVFFVTTAGLVSGDVEEDPDIYDARLGGGFAPVGALRQPCSGDACQGPLTNPAPLLVPGSVPQAPGENFAPPAKAKVKKDTKRKSSKKKKRKRRVKGKRAVRRAVRAAHRDGGLGYGGGR